MMADEDPKGGTPQGGATTNPTDAEKEAAAKAAADKEAEDKKAAEKAAKDAEKEAKAKAAADAKAPKDPEKLLLHRFEGGVRATCAGLEVTGENVDDVQKKMIELIAQKAIGGPIVWSWA